MTQILKGDTFADGQQVTGARLNQLVDSAQILVGSITEQVAITAGTVDTADQLNISDTSAAALRKATVGDLLGSNIPVITSSVTAGNGSDIVVTPNDATLVAGSSYTSADGLTVVVTTLASHGLSVGDVVLISGAGTGYNGTFRLTVASGTSFTYVMSTAATAGSGTLSYTKKGTQDVAGNLTVSGNAYVDGGLTIGGNLTSTGTLNISGNIVSSSNFTNSGTANFTGALQVNNEAGYVLTEIYEHTIPTYIAAVGGQFNNIYISPSFTKPTGEIWIVEIQAMHSGKGGYVYEFAVRYGSQTPTTGSYIGYERFHDGAGGGAHCIKMYLNRWVFDVNTTFTNETIRVDCNLGNGSEFQFAPTIWQYGGFVANVMATPSKLRIYKYKTA